MANENGHIESCVIVAEVDGYCYRYHVPVKNIESSIKTIQATYDYLGKDCSQVYIAGFDLVSEGTNLSREKLIKRIASATGMKKLEDSTPYSR